METIKIYSWIFFFYLFLKIHFLSFVFYYHYISTLPLEFYSILLFVFLSFNFLLKKKVNAAVYHIADLYNEHERANVHCA